MGPDLLEVCAQVLGASSGASPLTKLLKMPRLIKALRVLKMTKLTRAYKLDEVISQLATHLHVPPNAATLVILGTLGLVVNHVFACIWYYLGADDFSEECSTADVPARACTWMQVHGLHPHRTVWNSPPRRVDLISAQAPGQLVPLHHLPVLVSHDAVDCRLRRHIA